jgi:hypothetical protein
MYDIDYVVSRTNDIPVQVRTSAAPRLEGVVASARSQFLGSVKLFRGDVIGFIIRDDRGAAVYRWYEGDEAA